MLWGCGSRFLNLNLNGNVVRSQYWLLYTTRGVCACYWVFEPQIRRLKSVMVSAWTCDSWSWFHSTIVFNKNEFLNCSVWAVGTRKHLVLLVIVNKLRIHGAVMPLTRVLCVSWVCCCRRLYQFIGCIPDSPEPPVFQHVFSKYEDVPGEKHWTCQSGCDRNNNNIVLI